MRNYCCYNRKKSKTTIKKTEKSMYTCESFDTFVKTFDVREKRIGIVFKVIYVIAALFASVFLLVSNDFGKGLSNAYIAYASSTAFLMQLLYKLIVYIFNELRCLKIKGKNVCENEIKELEKQIRKAEDSYASIFSYFTAGGISSVFAWMVLFCLQEIITKQVSLYIFTIGIVIGSALGNGYYKKNILFWKSLCSSIKTIAIIALLVAMAFETSA